MPKKKTPYMFLMPSLIIIFVMTLIPIVFSFALAFGNYNGFSGYTFEGISNFTRLFKDPYFVKSIANILILLVFTIPLQIFLGLVLANLLNERFIRGRTFFRTAFYLPVITSGVAVTFLFGQLLANDGLINNFLLFLGLNPVGWLTNPLMARVSMIIIIVWKGTGYYVTLYLAGMQSIPDQVYEAADIDGASSVKKLFRITLPLLKPIIFFSFIMATVWGLNTFEVPNILFSGGQGTGQVALVPGSYLYNYIITTPDYGYASAIAWVVAITSILIAWLQFKVGGDDES